MIHEINEQGNVEFKIIGFLDDDEGAFNVNKSKYGYQEPYLGKLQTARYYLENLFVPCFSKLDVRSDFINSDMRLKFATIIHPSSVISANAEIGEGNIIYPFCVIGSNAAIGRCNILTSFSFISHDCRVGCNNFFSTAGLAGNVVVGDSNFFGIRATVVPSTQIGSNNIIQAGMVINNHVSNNETVFYKHKEKINVIRC